jgi:peptidoglycan/LPS O-acetylase OafA/YrhL
MQYRGEIDGLRALAVLPVIFFHAGFAPFQGGFVGVDVFFVISGYLITSLIFTEKEAGTFSLVAFYERRARRILPALFLVMAACVPFAWMWMLQSEFEDFGRSLVAASLFSSNILFWQQSGYFDTAAELKPLLHTWSLGVEEQYYLLFPLFILGVWRLGRKAIIVMLAVVAAASLAAAQWGAFHKPGFTYFMLPTRGWELLIGSFVALYLHQREQNGRPIKGSDAGGAAGLALLAASVLLFDKHTPFPSLLALLPTVGTALMIMFVTPSTIFGRLLGSRWLVGVGLISYGAYLWHVPLFVFARQRTLEKPSGALLLVLTVAAFAIAYLSWRWVEQPFRSKSTVPRKAVLPFAVAGSATLVVLGVATNLVNGDERRLSADRVEFARYFDDSLPGWPYKTREGILEKYRYECDFYDLAKARTGRPTETALAAVPVGCYTPDRSFRHVVFIWGDSHAQHLSYGLRNHLPRDWQVLQVSSSGCAAKLDALPDRENYCEYANWFAYRAILQARPDVVVLGRNNRHDPKDMMQIAQALARVGVNRVIITGPSPHWEADLPKIVLYKLWDSTPRRTFAGVDMNAIERDRVLKSRFGKVTQVRYVSLIDYFCNAEGCLTYMGDDRMKGLTSWDSAHLTPIASDAFGRDVLAPAVVDGTEP